MKRIFVKWGFTNDYGTAYEDNAKFDWFETKEQADDFIARKRAFCGAYFQLWKVAEGDYANYKHMLKLLDEIEQLKQEF